MNKDRKTPNVVVVTHGDRYRYLIRSIPALLATRHPMTLTVVANDLAAKSLIFLQSHRPDHRLIINDENRGYPAAANQGWKSRDADYTVIVGDDCIALNPDWLFCLVDIIDHCPDVGIVGHSVEGHWPPKKVNRRTVQIQPSGLGGIYLIPRRTQETCGYFNEELGLYGEEDALYGWKVRRIGKLCAYWDDTELGRAFEHIGDEQPVGYAEWKAQRRAEAIPIRDDLIEQYQGGRPLNT